MSLSSRATEIKNFAAEEKEIEDILAELKELQNCIPQEIKEQKDKVVRQFSSPRENKGADSPAEATPNAAIAVSFDDLLHRLPGQERNTFQQDHSDYDLDLQKFEEKIVALKGLVEGYRTEFKETGNAIKSDAKEKQENEEDQRLIKQSVTKLHNVLIESAKIFYEGLSRAPLTTGIMAKFKEAVTVTDAPPSPDAKQDAARKKEQKEKDEKIKKFNKDSSPYYGVVSVNNELEFTVDSKLQSLPGETITALLAKLNQVAEKQEKNEPAPYFHRITEMMNLLSDEYSQEVIMKKGIISKKPITCFKLKSPSALSEALDRVARYGQLDVDVQQVEADRNSRVSSLKDQLNQVKPRLAKLTKDKDELKKSFESIYRVVALQLNNAKNTIERMNERLDGGLAQMAIFKSRVEDIAARVDTQTEDASLTQISGELDQIKKQQAGEQIALDQKLRSGLAASLPGVKEYDEKFIEYGNHQRAQKQKIADIEQKLASKKAELAQENNDKEAAKAQKRTEEQNKAAEDKKTYEPFLSSYRNVCKSMLSEWKQDIESYVRKMSASILTQSAQILKVELVAGTNQQESWNQVARALLALYESAEEKQSNNDSQAPLEGLLQQQCPHLITVLKKYKEMSALNALAASPDDNVATSYHSRAESFKARFNKSETKDILTKHRTSYPMMVLKFAGCFVATIFATFVGQPKTPYQYMFGDRATRGGRFIKEIEQIQKGSNPHSSSSASCFRFFNSKLPNRRTTFFAQALAPGSSTIRAGNKATQ